MAVVDRWSLFKGNLCYITSISKLTVWRKPHFLQAELNDALLIGGDGRALDGDVVLQGCVGRINGDLQ